MFKGADIDIHTKAPIFAWLAMKAIEANKIFRLLMTAYKTAGTYKQHAKVLTTYGAGKYFLFLVWV